jgi:hypothetical protein
MLKEFIWGPVIGQKHHARMALLPLPPAEAAKAASAFCPQFYFFLGYGMLIYRTDTLRVLYVAAPQVFYLAYISELADILKLII